MLVARHHHFQLPSLSSRSLSEYLGILQRVFQAMAAFSCHLLHVCARFIACSHVYPLLQFCSNFVFSTPFVKYTSFPHYPGNQVCVKIELTRQGPGYRNTIPSSQNVGFVNLTTHATINCYSSDSTNTNSSVTVTSPVGPHNADKACTELR